MYNQKLEVRNVKFETLNPKWTEPPSTSKNHLQKRIVRKVHSVEEKSSPVTRTLLPRSVNKIEKARTVWRKVSRDISRERPPLFSRWSIRCVETSGPFHTVESRASRPLLIREPIDEARTVKITDSVRGNGSMGSSVLETSQWEAVGGNWASSQRQRL